MDEATGGSLTTTRKRQVAIEKSEDKTEDMKKMNLVQVQVMTSEQQMNEQEEEKATAHSTGDCEDDDKEEEETLVVLELCDFKNHPIFDDYSSVTLEGIDTATPMLRIGEYALHGQLEETVGTSYFYDTDKTRAPDKMYQFVGQTIKKIKFTIAPPEDL
ncbi:unnamed protein product [Peronospora destructor]|uniref:Transcription factor TFIIIC triple barrel domain-containing protein n=1 Tax=Peronospora destructor TaxID=86335 RepID=A0AAV0U7M9_9STRA|nr:unnamed protein product [Peronospora destructor]